MFDLETLKETLGDETFTELETYINDLQGQRDAARNESIKGRKGLKSELAEYRQKEAELLERLGVDSFDDVQELANDGQAEAAKQYEAKLKRLERQLTEATEDKANLVSRFRDERQGRVISDALAGHEFVAPDVVSSFINNRLVWEEDELLYKNDDGHLVSVSDGVAAIAKTRPELVKSTGTSGAGVRSNQAGESGSGVMSRAEFEAMPPDQQMKAAKEGVSLQ